MGLDMYLEIKKESYVSEYFTKDGLVLDFSGTIKRNGEHLSRPDYVQQVTYYGVGYWRKANAIHKYFVDYCGEGIDECQKMEVSLSALKNLLFNCKEILKHHDLAEILLPSQSGFFFGSTEYDEWYFKDLEDTIKIIEPVIEFLENIEKEDDSYNYSVIYQASW